MHVFPLPQFPLSLSTAPRLGTNAAAVPQTQSPSKEDLCRGHKGGCGKGEERWRRHSCSWGEPGPGQPCRSGPDPAKQLSVHLNTSVWAILFKRTTHID